MKTAQQWFDVLPESLTLKTINDIQADALEQAVSLLTCNADSPTRGFNAVYRLMVKLQKPKQEVAP